MLEAVPDSQRWYVALIAAVVLLRLVELAWSARNARRLRWRGGVEAGAGHYPLMVGLHAAFLAAAPAEVLALGRPFVPALGLPMLALLLTTIALRFWVIITLGDRWCTRVIVPPGETRVTSGPDRLMRHPNYLGVAVEVPALALVHTAWITALVFTALNAALLRTRIRVEEAALERGVSAGGAAR
jgi:methyltransferase